MNSARSFKEFHEASFLLGQNQEQAKQLADEFFANFIEKTPYKLRLLEEFLANDQIDFFYASLTDLKNLIEFSDDLSRYWHLLRGYSGALSRLKTDLTVKGAKNLYVYYFNKYGDRRLLRNEHWFEKKRWEFLDEMQSIYFENDLRTFYKKYKFVLSENFQIYNAFLMLFVNDLKSVNDAVMPSKTVASDLPCK
jgi:hypothetical protein